jgi:hypothetical protein
VSAGGSEADRLRRCRELFEHAQAAGVTLDEQRRREARARWDAADRRLAARREERDPGRELSWYQK